MEQGESSPNAAAEPEETQDESAKSHGEVIPSAGEAPGPAIEAERTAGEVVEHERDAAPSEDEPGGYEDSVAGLEGEAESSPETDAADVGPVSADSPEDRTPEPTETRQDKRRGDADD